LNRATSLYLDVVRPICAFIVLLSHVSYPGLTGGRLTFFSHAGVEAVDVFFVLSGFVIAHVCATRERDPRDFLLSRAARIYSVAIPALILTAAADAVGRSEDGSTYAGTLQPFSPGLVIRSVLFVGEQWNAHRYPGSDGPYWSLGFEVWYYVAFAAFLFVPGRLRWLAALAALAFIGPKVALLFPAWLMGVLTYRICTTWRIAPVIGWPLLVAPLLVIAGYQIVPQSPLQQFSPVTLAPERIASAGRDYLIASMFASHLIGFAAVSSSFAPWLERHARAIRWAAGATFSVYLAHLPIMHLLAASSPWPKSSPWTLIILVAGTPVTCLAFAEISERRKDVWRRLFAGAMHMFETPIRALRGSM
jgi:peptidoglycan/LPS O-acetylase OafA/YrhL